MIYLRENFPTAAWQGGKNISEGVLYTQPKTADERVEVAEACVLHLDLTLPTLIDNMENTTDLAYCGWPDRLFLIGEDGRVFYRGANGPYNFHVDELEGAILSYLGEDATKVAQILDDGTADCEPEETTNDHATAQ